MTTLTVQPSAKDTYLLFSSPTTNTGTSTALALCDWSLDITRSILEFSLAGLPAGAIISAASLLLYYYYYYAPYPNPVGKTVWAYKLTRTNWVELEATWNIYKTGSNWTAAGGDYVTANPAGGSTTYPASFGWMSWDVLAIVQDAYNAVNPAEFLLKFADETQTSGKSAPNWYSKEYATDTTLRPKLVIEYTVAFQPFRNYYPHILAH